jgi:exonuclease VII small subunit
MMKNNWLAARNFENMYDIILAVTTLSLFCKTQLSGMQIEQFSEQDIEEAQQKVVELLKQIQETLDTAKSNPDNVITGTNPSFSDMVIQYRSKRKRSVARKSFYETSIDHVIESIQSINQSNLEEVIGYLHDIRLLIGETSVTDTNSLLGDL